ncbi:MAG: hypothetical protein MSG64_05595 [Pyrinomonadaceae bacterium MAG19_C2-C3]|nr:hypothetical protein [Pyrinomonadaceae bacterium MAG19_C2-C3]
MAEDENTMPATNAAENPDAVDSVGTDQQAAQAVLRKLRDAGFDGSDEKLAVALGRPVEEIAHLINGEEPIDDDIVMKARGIAAQRNVTVE